MRTIRHGSTDRSFLVFATDVVSGLASTGLTAGDVTAGYARTREVPVNVPVVSLPSADAAHANGGFVEVSASVCPGWYRFDAPDAAFAGGADSVVLALEAAGAVLSPVVAALTARAADEVFDESHLARAMLANKRVHTVSTGVDVVMDDDGVTPLRTMTPSCDGDDTITVTPS